MQTILDSGNGLLKWYFDERIDETTIAEILSYLENNHLNLSVATRRFLDLSNVRRIKLDYARVSGFVTERRRFRHNGVPICTAFVASSPSAYGMVRMYQTLIQSPSFDVQVFETYEDAAGFLGVTVDLLEPPVVDSVA